MSKRKPIVLLFCLSLFIWGNAQISKTVHVTTPGTLSTLLTQTELNTITDLTVTGNVDARDFKTIKYAAILSKLDVSDVNIGAYTGREGPQEYADQTSFTVYPANEFPAYSFYLFSWTATGKKTLTSIKLPNSITSIGINAFSDCMNLTENLIIPPKVTKIENGAFFGCKSLTGSLIIPNLVKSVGDYAFSGCSGFNGTFSLPDSIISIGTNAFNNCSSFTGSLNIPTSVTILKSGAFGGCKGFNGNLSIPNSITVIESQVFSGCSGFSGSLIIPEKISTINDDAFNNCKGFNGNLLLSDSLMKISDGAFRGCSGFTGSLIIPSKVTEIGYTAFMNCTGFNGTLTLPDGLRGIRNYAFEGCTGFTGSLTIPALVYMWDRAFYNCSGFNGTLTILSKESIPEKAFYGCSGFTGSLNILASHVGNYAFYGCKGFNGTLTFKPLIMGIGEYAFYGCSGFKGSLHIPDFGTFAESIGSYAFYGCSGFDGNLLLSSSICVIAKYAFYGCSGFKGSLIIPRNANIIFENVYENYQIGDFAFAGCTGFDGLLSIPDEKRVMIGKNAFSDCNGLTSLFLPYGVSTIGDNAFDNCSSLRGDLIIPSSVTAIGANCFKNCTNFTNELSIPASVTSIDSNAFMSCNFTKINAYSNTPENIILYSGVFSGINKTTCQLRVPKTKRTLYAVAYQWKDFSNIVEGVPVNLSTGRLKSRYSANPTGNGHITNLDTNDPTQCGVVWSTNPNPMIGTSAKSDKGIITSIGPFTYNLTNLSSNTKYYFKTYATNSMGTSYGEEITFTTPLPIMSAPSVSNLSGFKTVRGIGSAIQTFTISGNELADNITINAPTGFEVRQFGYNNFASSISITNTTGVISNRTIEVRLSASSPISGIISGDIICTSTWAESKKVNVIGEIIVKQLTITPPIVVTSKMIDGNSSAVITQLGTLQGVDATDIGSVIVNATANYDDANVGTNKTITVVYTLIGSAKNKYIAPENFVITNAKIYNSIPLQISNNPTVVTNKMHDGNTTATISNIGTLQGVEAADIGKVTVSASANYDNANVGINKTITVVYSLAGSAKSKYVAPENFVITNAKISDFITLNTLNNPDSVCEGDIIDLNYSIKTGTPTQYKITFNSEAISAGLQNVSYVNIPTDDITGALTILSSKNAKGGTYSGILKMKNELNSESPDYPFTFTINVTENRIVMKFDDIILFNNADKRFVAYQWLMNGVEIPGATKQFFQSPVGLIGMYSVKLTTANGKTVYTCPKMLSVFSAQAQVRATPNPVKANEPCKIEFSGFTDEQLKKANLAVYNMQGVCIYKSNAVQSITELHLPVNGVYIGKVTGAGDDYVFKIMVTK